MNTYIFSYFKEILPLVQFYPEMDITDGEAERLLLAPPKTNEDQDPFNEVGIKWSLSVISLIIHPILYKDTASALPLSLDRNTLRSIDPNHVLILKRRSKAKSKFLFYRNILPDLQITYCPECLLVRFFPYIFFIYYNSNFILS